MTVPVVFVWDGEAMVPDPRFAKLADETFVIGEKYLLAEHLDHSWRSRAHYFASLREVWLNLPDELRRRHPTPEHLRKWGLLRAGFYDVTECVGNGKLVVDKYAVVVVQDGMTSIFTPQSQSRRAMKPEVFQESKTKVLEVVAELIGVDPATLEHNAGEAA